MRSARWLARFDWMEHAGDHWWPVFGALYYIVAVKRVRGMRLVGLIRKDARGKAVTAPAPVAVAPHARERGAGTGDGPAAIMKWIAYTDGACAPTNPGPGRLGRRAHRARRRRETDHFGFIGLGTNQIAELTAAIEGPCAGAGGRRRSSWFPTASTC